MVVIGVCAWSLLTGGKGETLDLDMDASLSQPADPADQEENLPVSKTEHTTVIEPEAKPAVTPAPQPEEPVTSVDEPESIPTAAVLDYYIWPVSGEVDRAYSMDVLTFNPTMKDWRVHDGIDILTEMGCQVKATANGRVTAVYEDALAGTTVVLSHNNGLESIYSNLAGTPTVSVGDAVGVGQVIGAVGDTALYEVGEVCHLHFAMTQDGISVDPNEYLP